ncbi:MAG: restriction endonuclease subunit S [Nitrosomonas sp.]|nr:restriction endonuclease subunit S [Nitrosomonas sp.]
MNPEKTKFAYDFSNAVASGAAQPDLGHSLFLSMPFKYPDISTQQKIAAILSAYDDLIENNQRRIALLEKMAEEIYREWFVRLRFPGHEKVKKVKGVPEGWEVRTLASIASEIKRGIKKKNLADAERYLGLEHIPRRSISIKEWATASTVESDKLLFQDRDILFGKIRPYLHKVALAHFSGACSSDTIVLRPKEKFYEGYLLFTIFSDTFIELATIASKGTKMPRADWGFLKQLELAIPDAKLLKVFQTKFELLFSQIVNLLRANEVLTASRDLLLPRLISGKLSIEHLDIRFPSGMEESACD